MTTNRPRIDIITLESSAPFLSMSEQVDQMRHRRRKADEVDKKPQLVADEDEKMTDIEDEDEALPSIVEPAEIVELKSQKLTEEEHEEQEQEVEVVVAEPKNKGFSCKRLIFYSILFALLLLTFLYIVLPIIMPSCCDYRKDYLVFNEQNYNNDKMLPF